jgi:EAL domain-containing protein (putative c-di-GMP-specific phosphodiesterase class I)
VTTPAQPPVGTTAEPTPVEWSAAIDAVLADPGGLRMVFQPIADLQRATVAGYEALARFDGPVSATPDVWFAAAAVLGRQAELEALAVRTSLAALPSLPPATFLTVNVSPHLLDSPELQAAFAAAPTLARVIVELTEHVPVPDLRLLARTADGLRDRGAMIAVDDAGAGYSGLAQIAAIRPQLVKLDRSLVASAHTDPVKLALAELLGEYASRLDAWLLAEGVETEDELAAFTRIGVPLAQGWLLGRPGPDLEPLSTDAAATIRRQIARAELVETVAPLLTVATTVPLGTTELPPGELAVFTDAGGVAQALSLVDPRTAERRTAPITLRVHPSTPAADAARRAMTRAAEHRFDPMVCTDPSGRFVGVLRMDDLVQYLARG